MVTFDELEKIFIESLKSQGYEPEVLEIGDHPDNWYSEISVGGLLIKLEDITQDRDMITQEDRSEAQKSFNKPDLKTYLIQSRNSKRY